MDTHLNMKRILIFLAIVLGGSWIVVLAVKNSGMMETNPTTGMMLANYIIILLPGLANIITRMITREGWGNLLLRPKFKSSWKFYLAAWWLPLMATMVGSGLFFLIFPKSFDLNLNQVRAVFAPIPTLAAQPWLAFLVLFVQTMFVTVLINGIASMGEEFGWRAYLLPKLMTFFAGQNIDSVGKNAGARRAALLVGLVWGVWHFPLFFLGSTWTFPFVLIYVVYTCLASVLLSWVTLRSGSVWTASIGHGMLNGTSAFPQLLSTTTVNSLLGPGPTGLIGMVGYVVLALVLLFNPKAFATTAETLTADVLPGAV